jgi:hypothetical protein
MQIFTLVGVHCISPLSTRFALGRTLQDLHFTLEYTFFRIHIISFPRIQLLAIGPLNQLFLGLPIRRLASQRTFVIKLNSPLLKLSLPAALDLQKLSHGGSLLLWVLKCESCGACSEFRGVCGVPGHVRNSGRARSFRNLLLLDLLPELFC